MNNLALYSAKFLITAYTSILAPLLPVLMLEMRLSLTQAGALVSFFSLFNSILQPLLGWVEDRLGYRRFLCLAPLWVGVSLGALGFATGFASLAFFLFLAGVGICSFHPASFAAAGELGGADRSVTISFLLMAASLGFVAGPLLITGFVASAGIRALYWIAVPGLLATVVLLKVVPRPGGSQRKAKGFDYPIAKIIRPILPFFLYALTVSVTAMNLYSFVPIYLKQHGASGGLIGAALSFLSLGCAIGPLAGSYAGRRVGRARVPAAAAVLSTSCLLLFLGAPAAGYVQTAALLFLGFFLMLPFSILIAMAQERAPQYVGTVSSFLGGFVWGCGGVLVIAFARLAELTSVERLLGGLVLFPLLGLAVALTAPALRAPVSERGPGLLTAERPGPRAQRRRLQ